VAENLDDVIVSLDGPRQTQDTIRGVPGAFKRLAQGLEVWHGRAQREELRKLSREITVPGDSAFFGNLRLMLAGDLIPPHKNTYGRDYDEATPPAPLYEQP
jgi:hypothetical protein